MTFLALILVLSSAGMHAVWNLLMKRAGNPELFTWWLLASASVLFLPLGIILILKDPVTDLGWFFVVGTIALHVAYFALLAKGYAQGHLSLVYPIARGMGPALVPILGVVILNEEVKVQAGVGIIGVLAGIIFIYCWGQRSVTLFQPLRVLRNEGGGYALLTGLTIAVYSVWDKAGVDHVHPFLYMYLMTLGTGVGLIPYYIRRWHWRILMATWREHSVSIVAAGVLAFLSYSLILEALTFTQVSYVAPSREVSIGLGVILGSIVLKEPFGRGRLIGSLLIMGGLASIALSP